MLVVICDPGLISKGSHHFNWTLSVLREFTRNGLPTRVFAYQGATAEVLNETGATAHFADHTYQKHCSDRPFDEELNWFAANASFRRDLARLEPEVARPDAILIVPAVTQHQIEGLAQWFVALSPERRPKLAACLMFPPQWTPWGDRAIRGTEYYARAIARLDRWIGRSVMLYTETEELRAGFERLTGTAIVTAPIPWSEPIPLAKSLGSHQLRFGYFGHSRLERGFHLLPSALAICRKCNHPFELVVQIQHGNHEPAVVHADRRLKAQRGVRTIPGAVGRQEYFQLLAGCDVVLLPYDPINYRLRGSGLFAEAIIFGKPVIVTRDTSMAKAVERGECVGLLSQFDAASLAETMIASNRCHSTLAKRAEELGYVWYRSNNVEHFCHKILDFAAHTDTQSTSPCP